MLIRGMVNLMREWLLNTLISHKKCKFLNSNNYTFFRIKIDEVHTSLDFITKLDANLLNCVLGDYN